MSKLVLTVMARCASSRLPNKVCYDLGGVPTFIHVLDNVLAHVQPDYVFLMTTHYPEDDPLCFIARHYGIEVFRGANTPAYRSDAFMRYLNMKDDWYWIPLSADQPIQLHTWWRDVLPIALSGDYDVIYPVAEPNSIAAEFILGDSVARVWVTRQQQMEMWKNPIKRGELYTATVYPPIKLALVKMLDEWASEPWPFGMSTLDYPVQKLMLDVVYEQLYEGYPLHPAEVYNFLKDHPAVGQLVNQSLDMLRANQPVYPMGVGDICAEEMRMVATKLDYIEWREGDYELVEGYFKAKKQKGDKNERAFNRLRDNPYSSGMHYHSYYPARTYGSTRTNS